APVLTDQRKRYPITPAAAPAGRTFAADVASLRAEFKARGLFERPGAPGLAAGAGHPALGFGGLWAFVAVPSLPVRIVATDGSRFGFVGLGTLGHTASHHGVTDSNLGNRLLLYFTYPFLLQLSAVYWHQTHCVVHHPDPNLLGIDNDCDLRPTFYINE